MRTRTSLKELHKAAVTAMDKAYAPYSGFQVGAAVLTADGQIFSGGNVENASYGGTVCAERVSIWKAVTEGARGPITDIVVVVDAAKPWPPCGFCRQVLAEFAKPTCRVHLGTRSKITRSLTLKRLLPEAFTPKHLS